MVQPNKNNEFDSLNIKTFFNKNSLLNKDGVYIAKEFDDFFTLKYNEYVKLGYNLREITQIIISSATLIESKTSCSFSDEYDKKEKRAPKPRVPKEKKI